MKRLKKLFNKVATSVLLSTGVFFGTAQAEEPKPQPQPVTQTVGCPAFPDFKKPEIPMHRISRNIDSDPVIEERQELLAKISINHGRSDGKIGMGTRMAEREYLLLYGPVIGVTNFDRSLEPADLEKLKSYAAKVDMDAIDHNLTKSTAAALRLASDRTTISVAKIKT